MKTIRLTESDLHNIIKESVTKVLNEIGNEKGGQFVLGAVKGRAAARCAYQKKYQNVKDRNEQGRKIEDANNESLEHRIGISADKAKELENSFKKGYDYGFEKGMTK